MKVDTVKTRRRVEDALRKTATEEQLVKVAKILGVKVACVEGTCPFCNGTRPNFGPNQVRLPCQLIKGKRYMGVCTHGSQFTFVIRERLYQKEDGSWCVKVRHEGPQCSHHGEVEHLLSNYNIFPYEGGQWNPANYFAFIEEEDYSPLTQSCYYSCYFHRNCHCTCHCHSQPSSGDEYSPYQK